MKSRGAQKICDDVNNHLLDVTTAVIADIGNRQCDTGRNGWDDEEQRAVSRRVVRDVEERKHEQASQCEDAVDDEEAGAKAQAVRKVADYKHLPHIAVSTTCCLSCLRYKYG